MSDGFNERLLEQLWIDGYQDWKSMTSCCGGKGVSIWKPNAQRWECADCGTITSNDPSYIYNNGVRELPQWALKSPKKCTCGSTIVGSDRHSDWCDKYEKI